MHTFRRGCAGPADDEIGHRLRAIVVCTEQGAVGASDLARHCAERLPKYMILKPLSLGKICPEPRPARSTDKACYRKLPPT
jgi:hypothetical protein